MRCSQWIRPSAVFALVGLGLNPLFSAPPLADDLQLLTVGSGLLRNSGLFEVASDWFIAGFQPSSTHVSPIGGVVSAIHVWVANQLTFRTPLSLVNSWSLLRVCWIALTIVAAGFLAKRFLRSWAHTSPPSYLVLSIAGLVALSNLQIHALWSNDPVIAYPVASWFTAIVGLAYLSHLLYLCELQSKRLIHALISLAISLVGVLSYELMISYLLTGLIYVSWYSWTIRKSSNFPFRDTAIRAFGALGGLLVIGAALLFKIVNGTTTYGGTDISTPSTLGFKQFVYANLPWLPLANLSKSVNSLPTRDVDWSSVGTTLVAAVGLAVLVGTSARPLARQQWTRGYRVAVLIIGLLPGLTATLILLSTQKYQAELSGGLGSVYTNYAMFFSGVVFVGACLLSASNFGALARSAVLTGLVGICFVQWSVNSWSLTEIRSARKWTVELLNQLDRKSTNQQRCQSLDSLRNLSFPDYYVSAIASSLQSSHKASHGIPYCDYSTLEGYTGIDATLSGENYTIENLPDGRRSWWMYGRTSTLRITFAEPKSAFRVEIELGNVPCGTKRSFFLKSQFGVRTIDLSTSNSSVIIDSVLSGAPVKSLDVVVTVDGPHCQISTDPRAFTGQIFFPNLIDVNELD
jgi:hypothetical protein